MNKRLVFLIAVVAASAGGYLAIRGLRTRPAPSAPSAVARRPAGAAPDAAGVSPRRVLVISVPRRIRTGGYSGRRRQPRGSRNRRSHRVRDIRRGSRRPSGHSPDRSRPPGRFVMEGDRGRAAGHRHRLLRAAGCADYRARHQPEHAHGRAMGEGRGGVDVDGEPDQRLRQGWRVDARSRGCRTDDDVRPGRSTVRPDSGPVPVPDRLCRRHRQDQGD